MSLTQQQADDTVMGIVNDAWAASLTTSPYELQFDDVRADKPGEPTPATTSDAPWGKATIRPLEAPQATQGQRRWQVTCALAVQIFTPEGDGWVLGNAMAKVIVDALRANANSADGVWIYDAVPIRVGITGGQAQINVNASFRFQEAA